MANDVEQTIGGYPLLDDGTPFPGGKAFATRHPVRGTPAVLRKYRAEWLAPADSLDNFHERIRNAIGLDHSNLQKVVDCGFSGSDVFAVVEPFDGAALEGLVKDIGPMPTVLAVEYIRQTAMALQAVHDRGLIHGDVTPAHLLIGPLEATDKTRADGTAISRPAANAAVKLADLGLIPKRPSGREWAALDPLSTKSLGFLPPERVENGATSNATDLYGLGATLFFLLTGRAPYTANNAPDVVNAVANNPPAPLTSLRPDVPADLAVLVLKLIAKNPAERPTTAKDVAEALAAMEEPVALTPAPGIESVVPAGGWSISEYTGDTGHPETFAPAAADPFAVAHSAAAAEPKSPKKKSSMTEAERNKLRLWLYIGGFFWLILAPILWIVLLSDSGCFGGSQPAEKPTKKRRS